MKFSSLACHGALCAAILLPGAALADDGARPSLLASSWQAAKDEVGSIWAADGLDLYLPVNTWHNRARYSAEKIATYNENPWGIGFGKSRYDQDGDWHALYAMAFLESHNDVEPIVGYAFQKIWRPGGGLRLGAGFTAGITVRPDYDYVPIPVLLPLVSVEYGRLAVQSTYVPGGNGNGNILFTWLRWQM